MAVLTPFLRDALHEGRLLLREPLPARPEPEAALLLGEAYRRHALTVAGPAIPFDAGAALAAGTLLYRAAWYLLNANEPIEAAALTMPAEPRAAAQHLSADLCLRLVPALHRRARALRPGDELAGRLADVLRRWPLSGVQSDVDDGPLTPPDFAGHAGLRLLYAERLARHEKPAWFPAGPAGEAVELVWQTLGRDPSLLPKKD
jgi:MoxR-vWA-beta-propeller ternary system domain bpX4